MPGIYALFADACMFNFREVHVVLHIGIIVGVATLRLGIMLKQSWPE